MLGHLKPTFCSLSVDSKENYWEFYCSICASLRKQNNTAYSMLLNNELTLLISAFQDSYTNLQEIKTSCPSSAFVMKKYAFSHVAIDLAGQLSILLGWIKILDSHTDKPRLYKKILLHRLHKKVRKILPALQPESQAILAQYAQITQENEHNFAIIRAQSALLSQMLVKEIALKVEATAETTALLCEIFGRAGELIAIADHLIDLDKDQEKNQYNPIVYHAEQNKTPLAEEYAWLRIDFNRLKYEIETYLPQTNPSFADAFRQSLRHVEANIRKNLPTCMRTEEAKQIVGKMQTIRAGFTHIPLSPEANQCCGSECCGREAFGVCFAICCEGLLQGCCQGTCDSCCSGDCGECGGNSGTKQERKQRREARKQARQERRAAKKKTETPPTKPKDDTYE